jgi:7,8-dihydroneopterin aldolase/epimerase/oxygenase
MNQRTVQPLRIASAERLDRHVFVRDLELDALIGVHTHERGTTQPIRINIDLTVREEKGPFDDELKHVVDYEQVVKKVRAIVDAGHLNLVETLAERIAQTSFDDPRVIAARVRIEKLKAIERAASVGVEIERLRPES